MLDMWKEKAYPPCHMIHFALGVGALIVLQIARPFLVELPQEVIPEHNKSMTVTTTSTPPSIDYITQVLMPPYSIVAAVTLFCAIVHIISHFFVPLTVTYQEKEKVTVSKMLDPATCVPDTS